MRLASALTLFVLFLSISCGSTESAVTGSVVLPQGRSLPDSAVIEVEVAYIDLADAPAEVIAKQTIAHPKGSALNFRLVYNPKALDSTRRYVAEARIVDRSGTLLFRSGPVAPVITLGNPTKDVRLTVIPLARWRE